MTPAFQINELTTTFELASRFNEHALTDAGEVDCYLANVQPTRERLRPRE